VKTDNCLALHRAGALKFYLTLHVIVKGMEAGHLLSLETAFNIHQKIFTIPKNTPDC